MSDAPRIAIVDDDAAVCDSTRMLLEVYGFDAKTYPGGAEFLRANPEADFLIVDYQMRGLNGLDLVSELRKRGSTLPVIMMTAIVDPTLERRATELGISRILQKPVPNRALLSAIHEEMK